MDLVRAIDAAQIALSLLKLKEEEIPERRIWGHAEKLSAHLEHIKHMRENPNEQAIDDDEPTEDVSMVRNELVDEYMKVKG